MRKLLLTSVFTPELAQELIKLLPTPPSETKLAFIATASEVGNGQRGYVLRDRAALEGMGLLRS